MEPVITAALIGVSGTLFTTLVANRLKQAYDDRNYTKVPKNRQKAIQGSWTGMVTEKDWANHNIASYRIDVTVISKRRRFLGNGKLTPGTSSIDIRFNGMFFDDKYLLFNYVNANPHIKHYGVAMVELSDDACTMKGEVLFCGFDSPTSRASLEMTHE
jgi:hypothetical protein